jgi:predicted transcriptional regulator
MYGANLSYKVLGRYLSKVLEASLITFEKEKKCYMLTAKGQEFLAIYHEYTKKIKFVEKRLKVVQTMEKDLNELCSLK